MAGEQRPEKAKGAFGEVFDAASVQEGVDQAVAQLQEIESPCQSILGE